jgi:hypothetical protein
MAGPADHDAVHAVSVAVFHGLYAGSRYRRCRRSGCAFGGLAFTSGHQRPVGLAFVHLLARAAVDAQGLECRYPGIVRQLPR